MYAAESSTRAPGALRLTEALRRADGIIIASPGYHGCVSGLVKNAIDYVEDLRGDPAPYFDGRAVGLIACAAGCQAAVNTLAALRSIVHALRGWPTPLAVAMSTSGFAFSPDGLPTDTAAQEQLAILARQVVVFSQMRALHKTPSSGPNLPLGSERFGETLA
jgi:FMN reductase